MCGIIGYIGNKKAQPILLNGLKRLEYRGYDSAGVATINNGKVLISKCKGRVTDLENLIKKREISGVVGLGHNRWATHGEPSSRNAHPHADCSGKIVVVHNGIIENFSQLKKSLEKDGCRFRSETDTEVIAHLISKFYKGNLEAALIKTLRKLRGSYALGIVSANEPEKLLAARSDSPLAIGLGKNENFIASDVPAIIEHTKKVIYLGDEQIAVIRKDNVDIFNLNGKKIPKKIDTISYSVDAACKDGFKHFMLKEIYEQPQVLSRLISQYTTSSGNIKFDGLNIEDDFLKKVENLIVVACGTAYHTGLIGKYIIESMAHISVGVDLSSEFRYRHPVIKEKTLLVAISQSGETADTLAAVREAKKNKVRVLSICNCVGSSLTRESDATIYIHAGCEIGVASTKAYTAQLMTLYLFGLYLAKLKRSLNKNYIKRAILTLRGVPHQQKKILNNYKNIKSLAQKYLHFGAFLYLGRNVNFPTALEGALKLKEISYIPAEGYAAGEMKHGPIALIDEYRAVVCIVNKSPVYVKMISNIQEILARSGKIIAIATAGDKQIKDCVKEVIFIPKIEDIFSPLLTVIPLQIFAYFVGALKGYDVDKPRNLAKSVTVE